MSSFLHNKICIIIIQICRYFSKHFLAKKRVPFLDKLLAFSESLETPLSTQEIREQVDTFMFAVRQIINLFQNKMLLCYFNNQTF